MSAAPTRFTGLAPATATPDTSAQQAFQQAVLAVENLREQLRELEEAQAGARRAYWQQVGPLAGAAVQARRALFGPLEEALLLAYFSRAEEEQIRELILANARTLHERFGEDVAAVLTRYGPAPRRPAAAPAEAPDFSTSELAAEAGAAHQQARRQQKTKAARARQEAERRAREQQQRLLSNTKTVYRQLARANHPDLERDPTLAAEKTTRMQRITAAYEADDLYALLQLLAESATADAQTDDVLTAYTQALLLQQAELKQRLTALKYGPNGFAGSTGKRQQAELRQLKRDLRAEADYVQHISRLAEEPEELRALLKRGATV